MMKTETCKNYESVADATKLSGTVRQRFLEYMRTRWPSNKDERTKSIVGYAHEWAARFAMGVEYAASDSEGQAILDAMARKE